ncbi:DUF4189 domain-containing protein [Marinibaculum pumilum]|uniref:DUF4189 domain-containing protein n=1 Tax=Marinibaculum pumilum TaxID=1766165 RepID=A0ABV7KWL8_9PROT
MIGKVKVFGGAAILACLVAGPAMADAYAALSFDPAAGAVGMSSHATKAEAEAGATKECRKEGGGQKCDEHVWSHNGCISLIVATKTAYGIGLAGSEDAAKKIATEKCVQTGGSESSCKDHFTACAN